MKLHHLVPIFILTLTLVPAYASAGHIQKGVVQKSSPCGCGAVQKHSQKSFGSSCGCGSVQKSSCGCGSVQKSSCGCGSVQKGKGHVIAQKSIGVYQKSHGIAQKSHGVIQKSHGIAQKSHGVIQKSHGIAQKSHGSIQKGGFHSKSGCSKGGCSTCCIAVIPAVLNGVHHLTSTVGHVASRLFACDSCGAPVKSKSGCSSKGCGCSGSSKVGLPDVPSNPFEDDDLQPPPLPTTEARRQVERRPIHQQVTRRPIHQQVTRAKVVAPAPVVQAEPRPLVVAVAAPLEQAAPVQQARNLARSKPRVSSDVRTVSADRAEAKIPHNPLRAK